MLIAEKGHTPTLLEASCMCDACSCTFMRYLWWYYFSQYSMHVTYRTVLYSAVHRLYGGRSAPYVTVRRIVRLSCRWEMHNTISCSVCCGCMYVYVYHVSWLELSSSHLLLFLPLYFSPCTTIAPSYQIIFLTSCCNLRLLDRISCIYLYPHLYIVLICRYPYCLPIAVSVSLPRRLQAP